MEDETSVRENCHYSWYSVRSDSARISTPDQHVDGARANQWATNDLDQCFLRFWQWPLSVPAQLSVPNLLRIHRIDRARTHPREFRWQKYRSNSISSQDVRLLSTNDLRRSSCEWRQNVNRSFSFHRERMSVIEKSRLSWHFHNWMLMRENGRWSVKEVLHLFAHVCQRQSFSLLLYSLNRTDLFTIIEEVTELQMMSFSDLPMTDPFPISKVGSTVLYWQLLHSSRGSTETQHW